MLGEVNVVKRLVVLAAFLFLFSGTALALEFSADTVMTSKDHKSTGKIYSGNEKFRMDVDSSRATFTITRLDKKVVWNVMPAEKMYMEMPFEMKKRPMVDEKMEGEIERKQVGNETIDGHPTIKYLITYKSGNKQQQVYQWFATDIKFPVKTSAVDGSWIQEYKNIKIGPQPNSLFEVPGGYKKVQMPGGMNFNIPK